MTKRGIFPERFPWEMPWDSTGRTSTRGIRNQDSKHQKLKHGLLLSTARPPFAPARDRLFLAFRPRDQGYPAKPGGDPANRGFPEDGSLQSQWCPFSLRVSLVPSADSSHVRKNCGTDCLSELIGNDWMMLKRNDWKQAPGNSPKKSWPMRCLPHSCRNLSLLLLCVMNGNSSKFSVVP